MYLNIFQKTVIGLIAVIMFSTISLTMQVAIAEETDEKITVRSFTTQDQNGGVADFLITFSKDVIDDNLLFTELPKNVLQVTPSVEGKARWIAHNQIGFFLDSTLAPSVEYTFEISIPDVDGYAADSPGRRKRKFTYLTEPFKIEKAEIGFQSDKELKKAKAVGTITFNYPVSIIGLDEFLTVLIGGGDEVPYIFQPQSQVTKTVLIEIEDIVPLLEGRYLQVKIGKGFKCAGTEIGLESLSVAPVQLRPMKELQVQQASFEHRDSKPYIRLYFSSPITLEMVRNRINIEPSLQYQLVVNHHELEVHGDFAFRSEYTVNIRRGATSEDGSILRDTYLQRLKVPDLPRSIRFTDDTFFIPRRGVLNLELATSNIEKVGYGIAKVYLNSLPKLVHQGELAIAPRLNEEVITPLPLKEILKDEHAGIFKVVVHSDRGRAGYAEKLILITDLGIVAKRINSELWVWVNSLDSLAPIPQAAVQLINQRNKEVLHVDETDAAGFVKFNVPLENLENNPQLLLTVSKGADFSLLTLQKNRIPTHGFEFYGYSYLTDGYEAFLYTERGVYRPGETVNLVGIVRGDNNATAASLPIHVEIKDSQYRMLRIFEKKTDADGACEIQIPLPAHTPTGEYYVIIKSENKQIGIGGFQVEEYMPDRMKVSLATDKDIYKLGDEVNLEVKAMNLFGAAAVGRKVDASCSLQLMPYVPPEKWRSFNFIDATRTSWHHEIELEETVTDISGKASFQFTLSEELKPPSALVGYIDATVHELGGRAVTDIDAISIHSYSHYVGIKRPESGTVKRNKETTFEYIVIDTENNVAAGRTLQVTISAIDSSYRRNENTSPMHNLTDYAKVKQLETFTVHSQDDVAEFRFTPIAYGVHRVEVEDVEGGAKVTTEFYVSDWGGVPWSMENPDTLDMTLDKPAYLPGEKAKLLIKPPFPGKLLLTIEREKVLSYQTVTVNENSATLTIPVQDVYAPNVYLSAVLLCSTTSLKQDAPARAFGIIPLKIDAESHRLKVEIDAPERIRPNNEVDIKVRVNGGIKEKPYRVSIAAVDEGILQLTSEQTPDPHTRFYQQRNLKTISYEFHRTITQDEKFPIKPIESFEDLMNLDRTEVIKAKMRRSVISDYTGYTGVELDALASIAVPITIGSDSLRFNTDTVVRVKSVSLWSGLITTDANGEGSVRFKVPQFNGTLRVMAVAFSGADYGSASEQIQVREPVVLMPTFPRFLSGGDRIRVPVSIFNGTGSKGSFKVNLQATGPVQLLSGNRSSRLLLENGSINHTVIVKGNSLQKEMEIAADKEGQLYFDVIAHDAVGIVTFNLSASGNGEEVQFAPVRLPLRSAAPPVTKTGHGVVRENEPAEFIFPSNLRSDTSEFMVSVSPLPAVRFANGLRYLIQYPHGCLEQTTSRVFPLLYLSDLARIVEPTLAEEGTIDKYIAAGIKKLEGMLQPDHHFAYWSDGSLINNWSSIYASHFLVEARKAGYKVSDIVHNRMLEGLRMMARQGGTINIPNEKSDRYILSQAAYACYVLSAAGQSEKPVMHYIRNNRLDELKDYSHFHLAGAFALSGDIETALSILPGRRQSGSTQIDFEKTTHRETGRNFDSPIRAQAIMLDMLVEVNANHPAISELVESLTQAASKGQRWHNTQENAFAILALGKFLKKRPHQKFIGTITRNGAKLPNFDSIGKQYIGSDWDGERIELSVKGPGTCYYYWEAFGISRDSYIEQYGHEMQISRRYLTPDGSRVKNVFKQGELVVAEITFEALTSRLENVAVVDMLPAGFEIENTRLGAADSPGRRKQKNEMFDQEFTPNHVDIRDDRLVFYTTFQVDRPLKFYYLLRAVTEGSFTVPPVSAEAMYDPTKSAVASTGTIQVVK